MNRNLLRASLFGCGLSLPVWGLFLAFFVDWFWLTFILGAVMVTAGGCVREAPRGTVMRVADTDWQVHYVHGRPVRVWREN